MVVEKTFRGNHMPHWNVDGAIYHVSFRLADSVPEEKLQVWQEARADFRRRQLAGEPMSAEDVSELKRLYAERCKHKDLNRSKEENAGKKCNRN